jgi:hypothetical protein
MTEALIVKLQVNNCFERLLTESRPQGGGLKVPLAHSHGSVQMSNLVRAMNGAGTGCNPATSFTVAALCHGKQRAHLNSELSL